MNLDIYHFSDEKYSKVQIRLKYLVQVHNFEMVIEIINFNEAEFQWNSLSTWKEKALKMKSKFEFEIVVEAINKKGHTKTLNTIRSK